MIEAVLEYGLRLKKKIKNEVKQHSKNSKWSGVYQNYKQLYSMMNIASLAKDMQPIPKVFENIHQTSVDMRFSLLEKIKSLQKQKIDIEKLLIEYEDKLGQKQQRIVELQEQIMRIKQQKLKSKPINSDKLKDQILKLQKQNKLLKHENQKLVTSSKYHIQSEEKLRHELKEAKNAFSRIRTQVHSSSYFQDLRFENSNQNNQAKNTYDNILPSFSDYPQRNFTVIQNREKDQQPNRKVKSTYTGERNVGLTDQLWRFIYIQASQIEQFLQGKYQGQSNYQSTY